MSVNNQGHMTKMVALLMVKSEKSSLESVKVKIYFKSDGKLNFDSKID